MPTYFVCVASGAFHNSEERYPQPRCHPQTQTHLFMNLWDWANRTDPTSTIFSGKSAIAQTFSQQLEQYGRLGASFFFKRGHSSRGNAKGLISTIAYQLAMLLPEFRHAVSRRVENDPSIVARSLSTQLQDLIVEPCRNIPHGSTLTVVIDGLDECEGQNVQLEILRSLGNAVRDTYLPLRFFISCRPEPQIREAFAIASFRSLHHSFSLQPSFQDVHTYLVDEFARIRREHPSTIDAGPTVWPSMEAVDTLVTKSSAYFIYAHVVIQFIGDKDFPPTDRLATILATTLPTAEKPFHALNELYGQILSDVPSRSNLQIILCVIVNFKFKPSHIEQLLELRSGEVDLALRRLHSVLNVPPIDDPPYHPMSFDSPTHVSAHHASFFDFLKDPARSGNFYVDSVEHRMDLARSVLKMMSDPSLNRQDIDHVAWCVVWIILLRGSNKLSELAPSNRQPTEVGPGQRNPLQLPITHDVYA
ncbi:hypothetical protein DFH09DRAFT_923822 [Mycena vulgaris]|nr:hypothetical protein DFH09DRAFT_923822 [Mycena vulgaris]